MKLNPRISVIIPVYNVEQYLRRCIISVLNQKFRNIEVILVNDGSTDQSGSICDEFARLDSRIVVIHQENLGPGNARNVGTSHATGDYIAYIDGDDYADLDMLQIMYDLLVHYEADVAICGVRHIYENGNIIQSIENNKFICTGLEALKEALIGKRIIMSSCNKLIKRDFISTLSFAENSNYEDALFTVQLFLSVQKVVATEQSFYNYCHREGSLTSSSYSQRDVDAISIYQTIHEIVKRDCPSLIAVAQFRLQWAHFIVLDKMISINNYTEIPIFSSVRHFLCANMFSIISSPFFSYKRKLSSMVFLISSKLYKFMFFAHSRT